MIKHIPNFITSLNLASGFAAAVFILQGQPDIACWLVLAAMVFDFLDGFASRLLKAYSDMGKELDSLADMVSFGVVPGLIIYDLLVNAVTLPGTGIDPKSWLSLPLITAVAAIMPVCAGLRLAKFNIDTTQATSFKGLPTPANALAVIAIIIAGQYSDSALIRSFTASPVAIMAFSLVLSVLMVTRIPLLSLKFKSLNFRENWSRYVLVGVVAVIVSVFGIGGIPWIIPAYIAVSLGSLLF
jgi:CDP-diacylglycerol--serine O-phosphatidyltransferase